MILPNTTMPSPSPLDRPRRKHGTSVKLAFHTSVLKHCSPSRDLAKSSKNHGNERVTLCNTVDIVDWPTHTQQAEEYSKLFVGEYSGRRLAYDSSTSVGFPQHMRHTDGVPVLPCLARLALVESRSPLSFPSHPSTPLGPPFRVAGCILASQRR